MKIIESILVAGMVSVLAAVPVASRDQAPGNQSTNATNLKAIHAAVAFYITDYDDVYPPMSSPNNAEPRLRWADRLAPYTTDQRIFIHPTAPDDMKTRPYTSRGTNLPDLRWGGYGYNFQYLGNSRAVEGNPAFPFGRPAAEISAPGKTVLVAETQGVRNAEGVVTGGVYTIDPPLPSKRGSGNASGYYGQGEACAPGPQGCRSTPAEWTPGLTHLVTLDGQLLKLNRSRLDDSNEDRMPDNGWFTGSGVGE